VVLRRSVVLLLRTEGEKDEINSHVPLRNVTDSVKS